MLLFNITFYFQLFKEKITKLQMRERERKDFNLSIKSDVTISLGV